MGKIEYFSIILHKSNPVYVAGEIVAGTINIRVIERLKCNSISMVLNGRARVHWYLIKLNLYHLHFTHYLLN